MDGIGSGIGKLGFGLMRLPVLEDGKIDIEQTKKMVELFWVASWKLSLGSRSTSA